MAQIEGYASVERWLERLAPSTAKIQRNYFTKFTGWLKVNGGAFKDYTPDMLIDYQRKSGNGSSYDIVDVIQLYIAQCKGRQSTKTARYNNVRSFFKHNRCSLPEDPSFKIRSNTPPVMGTLTVDEIKRTILSCNKAYMAIYLSMFQGAMDQESFVFWNNNGYDSLMTQLNNNANIIKIDLPGRKSNRNKKPFYTFIGSDAVAAIKNWLQIRPENARTIFTNQYGRQQDKQDLKQYWLARIRKIGLVEQEKGKPNTHRTGKNLHEMRDVWRSLWSKSPASHTVSEYLMGHIIDPLNYDKSFRDVDFYQNEYEKALPMLQIMSRGEPFGQVDSSEVEELRQQLAEAKQGQTSEMMKLQARIQMLEREKRELPPTLDSIEAIVDKLLAERLKQTKS